MKAIICDICGKGVRDVDALVLEISEKYFNQKRLGHLDICPECRNKINSCIADLKVTKFIIPGLEDEKNEV